MAVLNVIFVVLLYTLTRILHSMISPTKFTITLRLVNQAHEQERMLELHAS
jgi:hypothetical protein